MTTGGQFSVGVNSNVPLAVALLHEAGDGHAVFRLEVAIRIRRFGHLLTLTDKVLHFTFESALKKLPSIVLALISFTSFAQSTKDLVTIDKEVTAVARENNIETVKNFCVDYWTSDPGKRDILAE